MSYFEIAQNPEKRCGAKRRISFLGFVFIALRQIKTKKKKCVAKQRISSFWF
jgi:hypothetical protein